MQIGARQTFWHGKKGGIVEVAGIDNNAVAYDYTNNVGIYDNAAVIDTRVVPDATTEVQYSAYFYPMGTRSSGYVTGVYFGSLSADDANDSYWARGFVPTSEGSQNLQARMGNRSSGFYRLNNTGLAYHVIRLSRNGFTLDGSRLYTPSSPNFSPSPRYSVYIGGGNLAGRCWRGYRQIITEVVIKNGAGVNMHLIPAIVAGKVGMIDVNNQNEFFGTASNVDFTAVDSLP